MHRLLLLLTLVACSCCVIGGDSWIIAHGTIKNVPCTSSDMELINCLDIHWCTCRDKNKFIMMDASDPYSVQCKRCNNDCNRMNRKYKTMPCRPFFDILCCPEPDMESWTDEYGREQCRKRKQGDAVDLDSKLADNPPGDDLDQSSGSSIKSNGPSEIQQTVNEPTVPLIGQDNASQMEQRKAHQAALPTVQTDNASRAGPNMDNEENGHSNDRTDVPGKQISIEPKQGSGTHTDPKSSDNPPGDDLDQSSVSSIKRNGRSEIQQTVNEPTVPLKGQDNASQTEQRKAHQADDASCKGPHNEENRSNNNGCISLDYLPTLIIMAAVTGITAALVNAIIIFAFFKCYKLKPNGYSKVDEHDHDDDKAKNKGYESDENALKSVATGTERKFFDDSGKSKPRQRSPTQKKKGKK